MLSMEEQELIHTPNFLCVGNDPTYTRLGVKEMLLDKFYEGYVIPHVPTLPTQMRNKLMLFCLEQPKLCEDIRPLLCNTKYVPSTEGKLFQPCELYDPSAPLLGDLLEREYFVCDEFKSVLHELRKQQLRTLLDDERVISVAQSVSL